MMKFTEMSHFSVSSSKELIIVFETLLSRCVLFETLLSLIHIRILRSATLQEILALKSCLYYEKLEEW